MGDEVGGGRSATGFRVVGRVQGVGFRQWTAGVARELGLSGWVRNAPDGSVEVQAEGPTAAMARLAEQLAHGPPSSRVQRVIPLSPTRDLPSAGFEIRR